ncbi:MAG TPA: rhodanese-like domain-containing protein, partial [Nitratifractor sp.]|nr:rhodanese-like domain-containing protein [Nitratifractor sp.]
LIFLLAALSTLLLSEETRVVNLTATTPSITTNDHWHKITIERIQDTEYRLTDDFTKTSRVCPPFCIQPIKPVPGVHNIEELELIDFIKNKIPSKKGLLIDARLRSWYESETIPGAINIPFKLATNDNPKVISKLFSLLGAKPNADGTFDFSKAKELVVFCNGVWCEQSPAFMRGLVKNGYPAEKLYFYRSGFQGWKILGLTTVIHKANEAKK